MHKYPKNLKTTCFSKDESREVTRNIKYVLFPLSRRLGSLNLIGRWLFRKGYLSHKSHCTIVTLHNSHVTNKKHCLYISTRLVVTKLPRWSLMILGHHAQSQMIHLARDHMFSSNNKKNLLSLRPKEIILLFLLSEEILLSVSLKPYSDRVLLHWFCWTAKVSL